ncbi:MAG: transcriptional repressor [Bacilli bacterium]|jgi:Fe2+ or Zn2+ uptake regulation protein|nr:transcriptional repressor [Bacilli bacterium]MCH4210408.1 transcriptional repressor [Bacilli bacterium]MCH4229029.1 transcriptional repressor [Bacilli bacterium]MCH4278243.1 transcriptional repressor [Bacilli bacterium]MCI2055044.1 transcriptional repressor [Bacilli bacterium]
MSNSKTLRHTNQKAYVINYLKRTTTHPTASDIYQEALKTGFHIGLTSVYRILDGYEKEGEVISIKTNGKVHYDYSKGGHVHFVCDTCGKIFDVDYNEELIKKVFEEKGFTIQSIQSIIVHGTCADCKSKLKNN